MDPQLQQMLEQLRDVHSPAGVSWWPPAPGWWVLAALVIAGAVFLLLHLRRRQRLTAYKKEALGLLDLAYQNLQSEADSSAFLGNCAAILRRVLLYRLGRGEVAQLTGNQWRELLQQTAGPELTDASLDALVEQQYRREPDFDSESLYRDLHNYIASLEPAQNV